MKKHTKRPQSPEGGAKKKQPLRQGSITIGMDLGDKTSRYCVLDQQGQVVKEGSVATTRKGMVETFGSMLASRIALEVGTHSPWVSRLLSGLGHEVIVANPRQLQLITQSSRKDDKVDAKTLARLARIDPELLRPIRHRGEKAQMDLMQIRVRAALVETRTSLVNTMRGLAKSVGERVRACDPDSLDQARLEGLPKPLQEVLGPLAKQVDSLTEEIQQCDRKLEQIARSGYPETALLEQVYGVGTLIALTFLLTVEDGQRFRKSRDVGCYVGLRPQRSQSGNRDPQLRITKEGDSYLRKMLVQGAHRVLAARSPDTDLKRWGLKLGARGGPNAKKRAIVAVARKLAILLHRLWMTGEVYEPLRSPPASVQGQAA
jgi:transposase